MQQQMQADSKLKRCSPGSSASLQQQQAGQPTAKGKGGSGGATTHRYERKAALGQQQAQFQDGTGPADDAASSRDANADRADAATGSATNTARASAVTNDMQLAKQERASAQAVLASRTVDEQVKQAHVLDVRRYRRC